MRFKSIACPEPSKGQSFEGVIDQLVPDQSMSLKEILERFTRGESVYAGNNVSFDDDSDVDLEKLGNSDLVDKAEYKDHLKEIQKKYEKQEQKKIAKLKDDQKKQAEEQLAKKIRMEARKLAKESTKKLA